MCQVLFTGCFILLYASWHELSCFYFANLLKLIRYIFCETYYDIHTSDHDSLQETGVPIYLDTEYCSAQISCFC